MLTEQEKKLLEQSKNLCSRCEWNQYDNPCIRYGRRGLSGKCPGFDPRDHKSDFEDAAEFEARVALWVTHNGCPNFDPPCAYTQSKPYPYMSWKETGGECPHIPHKRGYCNRWCKLMTARLAVEQEMEEQ